MTSARGVDAHELPNNPIASLQAGRAFAAIAVLFYHTNITLRLPKYVGRDVVPFFNSGDAGVHFFFVLSGFIICYIHLKDVGQPNALIPFAFKRLRRLLPALWAALTIVLCAQWLWPALAGGSSITTWDVISAFFLLPAEKEVILSVEWTLRHEVLFYVIFGLIVWLPRVGVTVFSAWLILSATLPWLNLSYPLSFFFSSYHVLFGLGALAAIAYINKWVVLPTALIAIGAALFFYGWMIKPHEQVSNLANLILGLGAAVSILGAVELERRGGLRIHRVLTFLGDASYSIYLVHFLAVSALCKLVVSASRFVEIPDWTAFIAVSGGALLSGVAFYVLVEKPLLAAVSFRHVRFSLTGAPR
jgi:peptidoglycan/LPS O-acetylase OafA/YrhL